MPDKDTPEVRFWSKVVVSSGCWCWVGGKTDRGYGSFKFEGGIKRAHRVAWLFTNGPIPKGLCVLHRCDNPLCTNPAHLFLGTQADNMRDASKKRRMSGPGTRGEDHSRAKITEQDVRDIRSRYAAGGVLQRELAAEYGLGRSGVSAIVTYRNWKHFT